MAGDTARCRACPLPDGDLANEGPGDVHLTKRALALPAEPPSVGLARAWVAEVLTEIGREELVGAAQLGVSELVTNAVLHGEQPVRMQLSGTPEHPRFEVHDASTIPPQPVTQAGGFDLDAFDANADDLARRAHGLPVRVASKSVRVPALLRRSLARLGPQPQAAR